MVPKKQTTELAERQTAELIQTQEVTEMFGGDPQPQLPIDAPLRQVKILRETPQFEMPDGETVESFEAHILHYHNANQYYSQPFGDGGGPPDCASSNGISADGGTDCRQEDCADCELNKYRSAPNDGAGKACTNTIRLYLLLDGDVLPCLLKAPPSSLSKKEPKKNLLKWLTNAPNVAAKHHMGVKYQPIKVRFSLETKKFASGMSASALKVETARVLDPQDPQDHEKLTYLASLYKNFMKGYVSAGVVREHVAGEKQDEDDLPI